jgi:Ni/Fe-hydrogenase subunit HybB-like protein
MDDKVREEVLFKKTVRVPSWLTAILLLLVVGGVLSFAIGSAGAHSDEVWQIYLVNFVFWTGVAQAGVVFSCALRIARGRWGTPVMRVAEGFSAFLPVSFLLLVVLLLGRKSILPYATLDYHHKEAWLNTPFLVGRHVVGLLILFSLSLLYVYYSLRQDLGGFETRLSGLASRIASGWKGEEERKSLFARLLRLAPAISLLYAVFFSFVAWDFMMSLDTHWYSTLFGIYYFEGSFLGAIGLVTLLSIFLRKHLGLGEYITSSQFRDLGKLMFGFSLGWCYLMFSQFLAIWYGNMPEETLFVIKRVKEEPFMTLSWVVISCCFFFPLVSLIPRTNKVVTPILAFIAAVSLSGLWLEKYILVVPSFTHEIHITIYHLLVTLGFFAAFVLMFLLFVRAFPVMPVGDPLFIGKADSRHSGGH